MSDKKRTIDVGGLVITPEDKKMVNKVLDSSRLSYGPMTRSFEFTFAKLHDSKFAVFTNSGTSCLHISVAALKEKYEWSDGETLSACIQQSVCALRVGNKKFEFPIANKLNYSKICIDCYQHISEKDMDYVIKISYDFFKQGLIK